MEQNHYMPLKRATSTGYELARIYEHLPSRKDAGTVSPDGDDIPAKHRDDVP